MQRIMYEKINQTTKYWKLYDSCGVHSFRKQNVHIHTLVEKRYPLTAPTITDMLNRKLQADHWNEMCYQLLKLLTKQLKNQCSVWKHPPVTAAKLMRLVYKLLLLVFRVNAASTKVTTAERLRLLKEFLLSENG
ncbi:hypothetical protein Tco_1152202 [Tanacetum coccineum]